MGSYEIQHFLPPLIAHTVGAIVGSPAIFKLGFSYSIQVATDVTLLNLLGGLVAARTIPAPRWLMAEDLVWSYLPMGWLGYRLGKWRNAVA